MLCGISIPFGMLSPSWRQVTHALLTRPPLSSSKITPKGSIRRFSLDLHVLGTPPAFVLSQDQTLEKNSENWLAQFWILTFFVKFAKTFWNWQGLKPCAIVVIVHLVLITAFLTVYFSNIIPHFFAVFSVPLSRESLSILSHQFFFVKTFFRFF